MALLNVGSHRVIGIRGREVMINKWKCMSEEELNGMKVSTDIKTRVHIFKRHDTAVALIPTIHPPTLQSPLHSYSGL
jgi:hypothetical protein